MANEYKFKDKLDYRAGTNQKIEGGVIVSTPMGKFTTNKNGKENICRGVKEQLQYPTQAQFKELYEKHQLNSIIDAPEVEA